MSNKFSVMFGAGTLLMIGFVSQVSAETCFSAKGKITNNSQIDGTTLGVVVLTLDGKKSKCALIGKPLSLVPGQVNFRHTIVCDNKVPSDEPQPQVTLNTSFLSPLEVEFCPPGSASPVYFPFEEISTPDPATAIGDFTGINENGSIIINGNLNCGGGIQMKFKGEFCFD